MIGQINKLRNVIGYVIAPERFYWPEACDAIGSTDVTRLPGYFGLWNWKERESVAGLRGKRTSASIIAGRLRGARKNICVT